MSLRRDQAVTGENIDKEGTEKKRAQDNTHPSVDMRRKHLEK
jgi:hypothetical protein